MPISPCPADERGYTLIEVLVVLAIMSLVAVAAISGFRRQPAGIRSEQQVSVLRKEVVAVRRSAIASGKTVVWRPDTKADIQYQPAFGTEQFLRFHADGSGNGGIVMLGDRAILVIDWLSGEVTRPDRKR